MLFCAALYIPLSAQSQVIYTTKAYSVFADKVVQGNFVAKVLSSNELESDYRSPDNERFSADVSFKFSINCRDNEMPSGMDHFVTLCPVNRCCTTSITFGQKLVEIQPDAKEHNLPEQTLWTIRLDMRHIFSSLKKSGYYTLFDGNRLYQNDFKNVYIAGGSLPLNWDFNNLYTHPELELKDPDGDGIYETTLVMNQISAARKTDSVWKLSQDVSLFPQYQSTFPISDAIYKLSTEEMVKAVEPDSTFRTGKEWAGVWTRDISYSIILSMAYLQPNVAKYSLLSKIKNDIIVQDTGTGGAYPVSTDRMIWAIAAWELYKVTGDKGWLEKAYRVVKNSIEADLLNAYDDKTGLVKGESSFLDWREQTYPSWMQPADIYESECLGTNAVHYQANIVLAEMAAILNKSEVAERHAKIAERIKTGINRYLWMEDKGYYAQYLYGRNYKIVSPRSEALGEALCVIFGIADREKSNSIVSNTPVTDFGITCIYPQIPNIPPYHNNGIWPFVQAYWALASARAENGKAVLESIAAIYRPSALFLTNKENFVAESGDFAGTQINSSNMLWSLSGNLALVHKIFFGISFGKEGLGFSPFVPKVFDGKRTLSNFKVRDAILNIEMTGYGNKIKNFCLDGRRITTCTILYTLTGEHHVKIILENKETSENDINKNEICTSPETPVASVQNGILSWNKIDNAKSYVIIKNGKVWKQTNSSSIKISTRKYYEYQIVAVDSNNFNSFASEPVQTRNTKYHYTIELEDLVCGFSNKNNNFQGNGYVEISKLNNTTIAVPVYIHQSGLYSIYFRYANGNGPVNTENKCALRTLKINGKNAGVFVFPQRGTNEWSNWGYSNYIQIKLAKGKNLIELVFNPLNENMNSEVNQAFIDAVTLLKID